MTMVVSNVSKLNPAKIYDKRFFFNAHMVKELLVHKILNKALLLLQYDFTISEPIFYSTQLGIGTIHMLHLFLN